MELSTEVSSEIRNELSGTFRKHLGDDYWLVPTEIVYKKWWGLKRTIQTAEIVGDYETIIAWKGQDRGLSMKGLLIKVLREAELTKQNGNKNSQNNNTAKQMRIILCRNGKTKRRHY